MFEGFDQDELLAYVEEALDPARAADLRRRLTADPQAEQALERLREDRAMLRSMETPALPDDLLAELEPMLARPMLMPRPADWRRRYRARRRWPLLAAAACLALIAPAALWVILGGWPVQRQPMELAQVPPHEAAPRPAPGPGTVEPGVPGSIDDADRSAVDGAPAQLVAAGPPASPPAAAPRAPRSPGEPPKFVTADLMLVVRSADEPAVGESLRRSLEDLGIEGALVRNFTTREAQELALLGSRAELRIEGVSASARAGIDEQAAGAAPGSAAPSPHRAPRILDEPAAPAPSSAQLWGVRELAPNYQRQLEFSQRGAAYTVSIPAGRLADLLARLEITEGRQAALRVSPPRDGPAPHPLPGAADPLRWLHEYPLTRAAIDALRADPDAVVFLPVVVEKAP